MIKRLAFGLGVLGLLVELVVMLHPASVVARQQSGARFEYLTAVPFDTVRPAGPTRVLMGTVGYNACQAGAADWNCREFRLPTNSVNDALREMLSTLGNEGWEMVSAVSPNIEGASVSFTYLFKRPK